MVKVIYGKPSRPDFIVGYGICEDGSRSPLMGNVSGGYVFFHGSTAQFVGVEISPEAEKVVSEDAAAEGLTLSPWPHEKVDPEAVDDLTTAAGRASAILKLLLAGLEKHGTGSVYEGGMVGGCTHVVDGEFNLPEIASDIERALRPGGADA